MQEKLSSSLEDYLETIYNFIEENKSIRAIDISHALNVSRASVTEALKKLASKNLINYGRYDVISMTEEGKKQAVSVISKHKALHHFFESILGLSPEEASENACRIEHVISENALDRIVAFTEYQTRRSEEIETFKNTYTEK